MQHGTDYEADSLRMMQAAIDRYLRHKNYPVSIITGREFTKSWIHQSHEIHQRHAWRRMFDQQFQSILTKFFISKCGRIHRHAVVHWCMYSMATKQNLSEPFQILTVVSRKAKETKNHHWLLLWLVQIQFLPCPGEFAISQSEANSIVLISCRTISSHWPDIPRYYGHFQVK